MGKHLEGFAKCLTEDYEFENAEQVEEIMMIVDDTLEPFIDHCIILEKIVDSVDGNLERYRQSPPCPHGEE